MRLLLDTHVLLWALSSPSTLDPRAREEMRDPMNEVAVSAASVWEIAIKRARGKLRAPDDLLRQTRVVRFGQLPISLEHAHAAGALPPIHQDPFDRMLVAQAQIEGLTIVTRDANIARYGVAVLTA